MSRVGQWLLDHLVLDNILTDVYSSIRLIARKGAGVGTPSVLFVCVKNGGKSQIAAAIMRQIAGDSVEVHSAGTRPGPALNAEAEQSVREVGASFEGEHPKPVTPELLASVDRVVLVGTEAQLDDPGDTPVETWDIDEPSLRGIAGDERMRLVRDDITGRVIDLAMELTGQPVEHGVRYRRLVDHVSQKFDGVFNTNMTLGFLDTGSP